MNHAFPTTEHWHHGQLLAFSALDGPTDYQHGLVGRTTTAPCGIRITAPGSLQIDFGPPAGGDMVFAGDFFEFAGRGGNVRGALLDAHHLLIDGEAMLSGQDGALNHIAKDGRLLVGVTEFFDERLIDTEIEAAMAARARWLTSQRLPPGISDRRRSTLLRAVSFLKGQVYSAEGHIRQRWTTPDRWPHKDMWLWDTAFHAVGWRHVDPGLAMEMIDSMFGLQRDDGFLTYRGSCSGPAAYLGETMTQPPVLAYAVKLVHETAGDLDWVRRLYPRLCAYVEWDFKHRDTDGGGLVEWYIEDDLTCRSGESGMDNSPRFDSARQLDAVDFNSYLAAECLALADLAALLDRTDEEQEWRRRHETLRALMNQLMWSEQENFYCDYDPQEKRMTLALSSAGFLPLYGGVATPERSRHLAAHLADPEMFATEVPVASVAVKDREHYAKDMWRGPVWMNINWLIAEGFERCALDAQAEAIRAASLGEIERAFERFGVFFEYYDDRRKVEPPQLLRKGENTPTNPFRQVIHDFGWTAALYVDLVFREAARGC